MSKATTPVPLECGHVQGYRNPYPQAGEVAYCRKCSDWSRAIDSVEQPAKVRCATCVYNRNYPVTAARIQAKAHLVRHPNHKTQVIIDDEVVDEYDGIQPLEIDGMSLREIGRNAAALLRAREG